MIVGVVKEIKDQEFRVGLVPSGVKELVSGGHSVLVEKGAGLGSGISDEDYKDAGAEIIETAEEVYKKSEIVIKVKEPLKSEYKYFREGLVIYCFFHIAGNLELGMELLKSKVTAVAYETIESDDGQTPVLRPMSEVAGRVGVEMGSYFLKTPYGGRGVLLSGVDGTAKGKVLIVGAGVVGMNAMDIAVGLGADVTAVDKFQGSLDRVSEKFGDKVKTYLLKDDDEELMKELTGGADLVIGGVHVPGEKTKKLITKEMVKNMKAGSVLVDVAVDQGGCAETTRPTSHSEPTYVVDGVIHYAVTNMPGCVPITSTEALTNASFKYLKNMCDKGVIEAMKKDKELRGGLNFYEGKVYNKAVAELMGCEFVEEL